MISNIVLWIAVVIMAVVIFALTRQIGVLFERVAPAGALAVNQNLKVGQVAPELSLQTMDNQLLNVGGASEDGRSQLLFWVSPECPVCKTLLPALKSAAKAESDWLKLVLASDGMELDHQAYVKQYDLQGHPYIVSELLGKTYGVAKLPYAVVIDEQGKIASMGIINSREHLESLFEAKERKVASIQDYLSNRVGH
ncbi:redoxin domain-containing protein [Dasania sp. GY-MA-18]|uniref:Redoxin domain-containing protein n=1 Tax=Dasania phycosphaerae TaxID=2950436 RepID=A0A9J6RLY7_9GAMM|nr:MULTISPECIES: redoxin domain-containing protein [Dasania]MCR8923099.1 redoxin domain-containing protein [Dasania sp. GY-MA-18]MCZ0865531.1 redoxin domain-containing protein [Dasania phycosphaerae]MCZ0869256.1 redoxin domain-containing protein [Dasania phycosphaerae]